MTDERLASSHSFYANIPHTHITQSVTFKTFTTQNIPLLSLVPQQPAKDWFEHLQINDSFSAVRVLAYGGWRLSRYGNYQLHGIYHIQGLKAQNLDSESQSVEQKFIMFTILFYCIWFPDTIYLVNPRPAHSDTKSSEIQTAAVRTWRSFSLDYTTDGSEILSVLTLVAHVLTYLLIWADLWIHR